MSKFRIGTCSWKYPSWEGLVYSAPKGIDYLAEYSRKYNTVEVDQWFWSLFKTGNPKLPNVKDVQQYRDAVSDNFRFTIKVPNSITLTHHYQKKKSEPLVENPHFLSPALFSEFLERLAPLKNCLGILVFQFGYLNKQMMTSQKKFIEAFGKFMSEIPGNITYTVEIRNPNYLNPAYFDLLKSYQMGHVFLQGYWMPDIVKTYEKFRDRVQKLKTVIIRLHGGGRKEIEKLTGNQWDKIVDPRDQELTDIARMASALIQCGIEVYVNVNNHYEGSAPRTIEKFMAHYKKYTHIRE
jgi:uncharacterized protein YecE (DUF72 family)